MKTSIKTTIEELESYIAPFKSREIVPFICAYCGKEVLNKTKHAIQIKIRKILGDYEKHESNFVVCDRSCSKNYKSLLKGVLPQIVTCKNCGINFKKAYKEIKKSNNNNFCSKSCAATYNNKNKTHGTRRSKLEKWLEKELIKAYPNLDIHFNRKDTIGSELDIYIPELKLAFEINGIFHYKPIYGESKLKSIQENDELKRKSCIKNDIELIYVDVSSMNYFTPKAGASYLKFIKDTIDSHQSHKPNDTINLQINQGGKTWLSIKQSGSTQTDTSSTNNTATT